MTATAALGEVVDFATDDPGIAQRFLIEAYLDNRMKLAGDRDGFRLANRRRDLGAFRIDECELSGAADFTYTPDDQVLVTRIRTGTHRVARRGGAELVLGPGDLALGGLPGVPIAAAVDGIHEQVLTLRPAALAAAASPDPGAEAPPVAFTELRPVSSAHGRMWRETVDAIWRL